MKTTATLLTSLLLATGGAEVKPLKVFKAFADANLAMMEGRNGP